MYWTPGSSKPRPRATQKLAGAAENATMPASGALHTLGKRAQVYGPLVPRINGLLCPGTLNLNEILDCPLCGVSSSGDFLAKRAEDSCLFELWSEERCPAKSSSLACRADLSDLVLDLNDTDAGGELYFLEKRGEKILQWEYLGVTQNLPCGQYESCGTARGQSGILKW